MKRRHDGTRPLIPKERDHVQARLDELRDHFHEWPGYEGREQDLVGFALYESGGSACCRDVIARAAPFALGQELVKHLGFSWAVIDAGNEARFAVVHDRLPDPIDLESLEGGALNRNEYPEPPEPGEVTHDSIRFILFLLAWFEVFGPESEVPEGPIDSLDAHFDSRGAAHPSWYEEMAPRYI